jgi:hypothetical protein
VSLSGLIVRRDERAKAREETRAALLASLTLAAGELLQVANPTVPKEEGILEGSGDVSVDEGALIAQVGYGGEAEAYAVRQHEDTTLTHDDGRRAKWLELAARENSGRLGFSISVVVRERLG